MKKLSLENAHAILSRTEMKQILAGYGNACSNCSQGDCSGGCTLSSGYSGTCGWTNGRGCTCAGS